MNRFLSKMVVSALLVMGISILALSCSNTSFDSNESAGSSEGSEHPEGGEPVSTTPGGDMESEGPVVSSSDPILLPAGAREAHGTQVSFMNEAGDDVIALLFVPQGTPPAGGYPAVVINHGCGGLLRGADEVLRAGERVYAPHHVTYDNMSPQFQNLAMLAQGKGPLHQHLDQKFVTLFPDGYVTAGRSLGEGCADLRIDRTTLLLRRRDDVNSADHFLNRLHFRNGDAVVHPQRKTALGISDGATTTTFLSLHDPHSELTYLPLEHSYQFTTSAYGGCGLNHLLDPIASGTLRMPNYMVMGEADPLKRDCDTRVTAVNEAAAHTTHPSWHYVVMAGAHHGFEDAKMDQSHTLLAHCPYEAYTAYLLAPDQSGCDAVQAEVWDAIVANDLHRVLTDYPFELSADQQARLRFYMTFFGPAYLGGL